MTWLPETAPGATPFDQALGLCPDLRADLAAFQDLFWTLRPVDPIVLELCRLRVAQILGCDAELARRSAPAVAAGLTEEKIAALDDWRVSGAFSDLERAALRVAETFVLDPHGMSDADVGAVSARLGPAGTVALVEALAFFDGFTRFRLILGVGAPGAAR